MKQLLSAILLLSAVFGYSQSSIQWPVGKKSLIVLTYDDALVSQLDIAVPQLDKAGFKGTFFLKEPDTELQFDRWGALVKNGHELGNHTVYHPCQSTKFPADARFHAENYTIANILREIYSMNKFLYTMDHKTKHTYAYPCYETSVGGKSYMDSLRKCGFVTYARGGGFSPIVTDFKKLDPFNVPCMGYADNPSAKELIDFVKAVQKDQAMGVFIFHGVGGDYLTVSAEAHQQLVQYLKDNKDIWVTTFEKAMDYVTKKAQ